jgi:hypothetical protein
MSCTTPRFQTWQGVLALATERAELTKLDLKGTAVTGAAKARVLLAFPNAVL